MFITFADKIIRLDGDYRNVEIFTDKFNVTVITRNEPYDVGRLVYTPRKGLFIGNPYARRSNYQSANTKNKSLRNAGRCLCEV